jgi:hypothetical protein
MREEYIKVILFWSLVATLPGFIFLIQVVMFMPANMMFAYIVLGISEGLDGFGMVLFFTACFVVTIGIWAILTILLAKLVCLVKQSAARNMVLLVVVMILIYLAFLPIYGSGGHGPMRWVTASGLDDARLKYWVHVFPPTVLFALVHLWYRHRSIHRAMESVKKGVIQ